MYMIHEFSVTKEDIEKGTITLPYGAIVLSVDYDVEKEFILHCLTDLQEGRTEVRSLVAKRNDVEIDNHTVEMIMLYNFHYLGVVSDKEDNEKWHFWVK